MAFMYYFTRLGMYRRKQMGIGSQGINRMSCIPTAYFHFCEPVHAQQEIIIFNKNIGMRYVGRVYTDFQ
jgi:hypothetical protein